MRVLVTGSRDWWCEELIETTLNSMQIDLLIEGEAPGADTIAREWAKRNAIPFLGVPAKWKTQGKAAGSIRNKLMFKLGRPIDLVVAFHDDIENSRGTAHTIKLAKLADIPVRMISHKVSHLKSNE